MLFLTRFRYNRAEWKNEKIAALTLTWPVILPDQHILGNLTITLNFQENVNFAQQFSTSKYHIYLLNSDGNIFRSEPTGCLGARLPGSASRPK